jgi:predicted enzyme involved in methoxymalonyl-ACP biosynthesis
VIYANLDDKFGENGITSVMICSILAEEIQIYLWVMSCRIFKRGMEFAMFDRVVDIAKKMNKKFLSGIYIPSQKNNIVQNLYDSLGFKKIDTTKDTKNEINYRIEVKSLKTLNKSIKVTYE